MADNTVTLVGNVTRDPELRFTSGGRGVASFGIAVNRRYQVERRVAGADVVLRRRGVGHARRERRRLAPQGHAALVYGRLEQRSWDTQDGEKRSKIEVVADEIGPSLRWAQAQVERTARTDRRRRPGRRRQRRPAPAPAGAAPVPPTRSTATKSRSEPDPPAHRIRQGTH